VERSGEGLFGGGWKIDGSRHGGRGTRYYGEGRGGYYGLLRPWLVLSSVENARGNLLDLNLLRFS